MRYEFSQRITDKTGLTWYYIPEYSARLSEAIERAKEAGGRLPTDEEAKVIIPHILQARGGWFWTSTPHPEAEDYLQKVAGGLKGQSIAAINAVNRSVHCDFIIVGDTHGSESANDG